MDRAFTLEKRSFDKTMLGVLGMSSPPSASVGVVRQLSMDANVVDSRGFIKVTDDVDTLNSANLLTTAELLTPFSAVKDDAPRTAMMTTQSKHVVAVKKATPVLVGNGVERALPYTISNDFAFKAKEDGKVIERDDEMGVMILQYKSGKKDFINTSNKIAKNGGGGFYISNKLEPSFKLGQSFKKNDIIAKNTQFFSENAMTGETAFNIGTLAKIAIMGGYYTYEDSCIVSTRLCDAMTTYITMRREVIIGKNSNVSYIIKKGQYVQDGDPLIIFDNSFDESEVNKFLASLSDETAEDLKSLGRVPKKAKYSGVIEDIVIYYTVDEDQLSPSLLKLVKDNNAKIKKVKDFVKKHVDNPAINIEFPPDSKTETKYGKIKGVDVGDGVYIEFYIKREDVMGVGDKMTDYSALKAVVCEVFPEGKEPYSEFRPDEIIDSFLGPISIQARMVCSVETVMLTNKVLIELKRSVKALYEK